MNYLQFLYKQVIRVFPAKANVINTKTSQIHLLPNEVQVFLLRVIASNMLVIHKQ